MEHLIIGLVAFLASILTFFSGYGLGTLLMPTFALFFPIEYAIAMTGIVHLLNNLFKTGLIGKKIAYKVLLIFGIPAILGAYLGTNLLIYLTDIPVAYSYQIGQNTTAVTWTQITVGILLIFFAYADVKSFGNKQQWPRWILSIGGLISGFFGGLSGHQGALRTAFLTQLHLTKETFIATGIAIACIVDFTRIPIYFSRMTELKTVPTDTIIIATVCALLGALIGRYFLKKISLGFLHRGIAFFMLLTGLAMIAGKL